MATEDEIIEQAALDIGARLPNEPLAPEDYTAFQSKYRQLVSMLAAKRVYIPDRNNVDEGIVLVLTRLLGNVSGSVVSQALNDPAWQRDIQELRELTATAVTTETVRAQYF